MEPVKQRIRRIRFNSKKNNSVIEVNTEFAMHYAQNLEKDNDVMRYQANVMLDISKYKFIDAIGIKKSYFDSNWLSSFKIWKRNGDIAVREIVLQHNINRPSQVQKLEFSRRYWEQEGVTDWKIILV